MIRTWINQTKRVADIVAPVWSDHLPEDGTWNKWCCEACGYGFEDEASALTLCACTFTDNGA